MWFDFVDILNLFHRFSSFQKRFLSVPTLTNGSFKIIGHFLILFTQKRFSFVSFSTTQIESKSPRSVNLMRWCRVDEKQLSENYEGSFSSAMKCSQWALNFLGKVWALNSFSKRIEMLLVLFFFLKLTPSSSSWDPRATREGMTEGGWRITLI
jgi:hypothetical protein